MNHQNVRNLWSEEGIFRRGQQRCRELAYSLRYHSGESSDGTLKKKKILIRSDWILCIALCLSLWFIDWLWQLGFGFGVWFRVQLGEGRLWFVILNFSSWIFLHFNVSTSYRWSIVVSFAKIISYRLVKILSLFAMFYLIKSFSNSIFNWFSRLMWKELIKLAWLR